MLTRWREIGTLLLGFSVGSLVEAACIADCGEPAMLIEIPVGRYVQSEETPVFVEAELHVRSAGVDVIYETAEGHRYQVFYDSAE